jgi:formylglycine-generating enzyme required for sulfatase activity
MTRVIKVISSVLMLIISNAIYSQSITNVRAIQNGEQIKIIYDFDGAFDTKSFVIELYISINGGISFEGPLKKVTGSIGENIFPGKNKEITWNIVDEFSTLKSDKVIFEIRGHEKANLELEFVYIEGGSFSMGSRDGNENERPVHRVNIDGLNFGKYEIQQWQWYKVMGNNPSKNRNCYNCPVENVTYNDVQKFIDKLNNKDIYFKYRLPTEAEWEYVASEGFTGKGRSLYAGSNAINSVAWYVANSVGSAHPVGEKTPNKYGIFDLSGNVLEWCSDYYLINYYLKSPSSNPPGPTSGGSKVIRGGSWNQTPSFCTVTRRQYEMQDYKSSNLGFRLVRINK